MAKVVGIIPARFASSRFPGKPLAQIQNKPMIQWVYERSQKSNILSQLVVATDDQRIYDVVKSFGGDVVMTPSELPSGTDRAAFVAKEMDIDAVVNIQGDEPLIDPEAIDLVAETLLSDEKAHMATLARKVDDALELEGHDTARVVLNKYNHALYFSRAAIPFARDLEKSEWHSTFPYYDQIGIYSYRKDILLEFTSLEPSMLEKAEKLEQLRALENGYVVKVGLCDFRPICVDLPEHIIKVEQRLRELNG